MQNPTRPLLRAEPSHRLRPPAADCAYKAVGKICSDPPASAAHVLHAVARLHRAAIAHYFENVQSNGSKVLRIGRADELHELGWRQLRIEREMAILEETQPSTLRFQNRSVTRPLPTLGYPLQDSSLSNAPVLERPF